MRDQAGGRLEGPEGPQEPEEPAELAGLAGLDLAGLDRAGLDRAGDVARFATRPVNRTDAVVPWKSQLLKWVGTKQRFAHEIIAQFPPGFGTYHEPFLGAGGVLGVLAPKRACAADSFAPLIGVWSALRDRPDTLVAWYRDRWEAAEGAEAAEPHGRRRHYETIRARFNAGQTAADLIYLSRAAYGGVIRFRRRDRHMSTPPGQHRPIHPDKFARRVAAWHLRVQGTRFAVRDYRESFARARAGDVIYCDPPYSHSQSILYGAQGFDHDDLFDRIARAKRRGIFVALSLDGHKKSGGVVCAHTWPAGLFEREVPVNLGASMLKRFQMEGRSLDGEQVVDRLLLTHRVHG